MNLRSYDLSLKSLLSARTLFLLLRPSSIYQDTVSISHIP